jgi:hypothetical protein
MTPEERTQVLMVSRRWSWEGRGWRMPRLCAVSSSISLAASIDWTAILPLTSLGRRGHIRGGHVLPILDPILLKVWVMQVFLERPDEGNRGLAYENSILISTSKAFYHSTTCPLPQLTCLKLGTGTSNTDFNRFAVLRKSTTLSFCLTNAL